MADEKPVKPFLKYPGGKRRMAKHIITMLPPHTCYVEPFGGMGAVLLMKPKSKVEVWNDLDGGLANVMRVVKYHPDALAEELSWMLMHRAENKRWLRVHPGETDIQRAARWIMVRHTSGFATHGRGFHVGKTCGIKPICNLVRDMRAVSMRLSSVIIESITWQRCIELYDSDHTVFFIDPPYPEVSEGLYALTMSDEEHRELRKRLDQISGKWIVTYADHPLIRDLYKDCSIKEINYRSTIVNKRYTELIITPR